MKWKLVSRFYVVGVFLVMFVTAYQMHVGNQDQRMTRMRSTAQAVLNGKSVRVEAMVELREYLSGPSFPPLDPLTPAEINRLQSREFGFFTPTSNRLEGFR